jgi:hypothetical protein
MYVMLQFNIVMQSVLFRLFISFDMHNDMTDFRLFNSWKLYTPKSYLALGL